MNFDINQGLLRADIRTHAASIRTLKRALGVRWERSMADEQRALQRLKLRVTELCALRAYCRGKLHLQSPPRNAASDWSAAEYHRSIAERLGPTYATQPSSYSPVLEQSA
jgi:hypothetical protein